MNIINVPATILSLRHYVGEGVLQLGPIRCNEAIRSAMGPFYSFPSYNINYPQVVKEALFRLYAEYNQQFDRLRELNREWSSDYQLCTNADGGSCNRWVQIDMVGLPARFLEVAPMFSASEVAEALRRHIFEIENSLAMYELLQEVVQTPFKQMFRASLEELRRRHQRPIAVLAVTAEKYNALLADEFGKMPGEVLSDEEVKQRTGFDRVFSPDDFRRHVHERGKCEYLLYVRSSEPVSELRKPGSTSAMNMLNDDLLRQIVRENSLTFNIDKPGASAAERINDTKAYMPPMGMACPISAVEDLFTTGLRNHLAANQDYGMYEGDRLHPTFLEYLQSCGIDPEPIATGAHKVRAKPIQGTYGCYGHLPVSLRKGRDRAELRKEISRRGDYLVQPEMETPYVVDQATGEAFRYIDRVFVTVLEGGPVFMGGFRSFLPANSVEAKRGRMHGNRATVWAGIS